MMQLNTHSRLTGRQKGVALVVALVLLVVVTLVGLAAIRGTSLQEKMAGNTVDRAQAFQISEATLDFAARTIMPPAPVPNPASYNVPGVTDCSTAPCVDNPATDTATAYPWKNIPTVKTSGTNDPANLVSLYGDKPGYLVQYLGNCNTTGSGSFQFTNDQNNQGGGGSLTSTSQCYRITTRGGAVIERSQIVLQAIYRTS